VHHCGRCCRNIDLVWRFVPKETLVARVRIGAQHRLSRAWVCVGMRSDTSDRLGFLPARASGGSNVVKKCLGVV
jgi:hypothetical protein